MLLPSPRPTAMARRGLAGPSRACQSSMRLAAPRHSAVVTSTRRIGRLMPAIVPVGARSDGKHTLVAGTRRHVEENVTDRLIAFLRDSAVDFQALTHPPVRTSEEAAQVRGTPLEQGAKALVFQADGRHILLVLQAHRRGIHVLLDFVANHSSSQHPYFQAALHDPSSQYRSWYRWSSMNPNQTGPWGQEVWHKSPVRDEYYYGVFWGGMPDLNYKTPAVLQEMQKVAAYWLTDMHADGFRFDAVPYLVEEGSQLQHTGGTHDVLRQFGNAIRSESPGSFTIGEVSDWSSQTLATYYPDQLDAYFAFEVARATVEAARTGDAASFRNATWEANVTFPTGRWSPFLTNHDQPRVMTVMAGDFGKARVAASAMLMLPKVFCKATDLNFLKNRTFGILATTIRALGAFARI